jgi:hypothetical protein
VDDPKRELRAFTVSLTANVGTKRRQDKGSFVSSVVSAIDRFFAEVVQHIKPWTQAPPKSRTTNHPRPIRPCQQRWRCPRRTTSK